MDTVAERRENFGDTDEIRIVEIVASEATCPLNDGSPGSGLYAVPFKLSRVPSPAWQRAFVEHWDNPDRFSSMHRPGIARVEDDRIVLDGTTIEEVAIYHKDTLELAVKKANEFERIERIDRESQARKQAEQDKLRAAHLRHVEETAKEIKFE